MYVTVSIWGEAMMAMETSSTAADTGGDGPIVCPAFRKSSWRRCAVLSALLGLLATYVCFLGDEGAMSGNGMVSDSNGTRSTGIRGSNSSRVGSASGSTGGGKKRMNTMAAERNEIIKERDLRMTTYMYDDHHRRLLQTTYDDDDITERSVDYDDDGITKRSVDESIVSEDEDIGKDDGNDKDGAGNDGGEGEEIEKKVTYWLPEVPGVFMAPDGNTKAMNKAPRPKLLHVLVA